MEQIQPPCDKINVKGSFKLQHYRGEELLETREFNNAIVDDGMNDLLNIMFGAGTQVTAWYCGLISGSPTLANTDTMTSHAGWTEIVAYTASNRTTWTPTSAAVGSGTNRTITNTTAMSFSINASATIGGIFISSSSTTSGNTGILWSEATLTGGNVTAVTGDTFLITYTLNG
jgi:hypothetical protein